MNEVRAFMGKLMGPLMARFPQVQDWPGWFRLFKQTRLHRTGAGGFVAFMVSIVRPDEWKRP